MNYSEFLDACETAYKNADGANGKLLTGILLNLGICLSDAEITVGSCVKLSLLLRAEADNPMVSRMMDVSKDRSEFNIMSFGSIGLSSSGTIKVKNISYRIVIDDVNESHEELTQAAYLSVANLVMSELVDYPEISHLAHMCGGLVSGLKLEEKYGKTPALDLCRTAIQKGYYVQYITSDFDCIDPQSGAVVNICLQNTLDDKDIIYQLDQYLLKHTPQYCERNTLDECTNAISYYSGDNETDPVDEQFDPYYNHYAVIRNGEIIRNVHTTSLYPIIYTLIAEAGQDTNGLIALYHDFIKTLPDYVISCLKHK